MNEIAEVMEYTELEIGQSLGILKQSNLINCYWSWLKIATKKTPVPKTPTMHTSQSTRNT